MEIATHIDENPRAVAGPTVRADWRTWSVAAGLILLVAVAFWPVLRNNFVVWDDTKNFTGNTYFRGLGISQLRWAWTTSLLGVYQPIAWMFLEAEYTVWGLNPFGYHLTSLVLHTINCVLLYFLTLALIERARPLRDREGAWTRLFSAGMATALFAVHPLRTETVAWASNQSYLPCAGFCLLAVLSYVRAFPADGPPKRGWQIAAFAAFVASLLSKAATASLPAVLLLLDVYPLGRLSESTQRIRRLFELSLEKLPYLMASGMIIRIAFLAARHVPPDQRPEGSNGLAGLIAGASYGLFFHVDKSVRPFGINAYYASPAVINWRNPQFLTAIVVMTLLGTLVIALSRRAPALLVASMSYAALLAPHLGSIGKQIVSDHHGYVPLMAFVVAIAAGLEWVGTSTARNWLRVPVASVLVAVLVFLTISSWNQSLTWRSSEALWTHALQNNRPGVAELHNYLGNAMVIEGQLDKAEPELREALRLQPESADAHTNLGMLLAQRGDHGRAEPEFREAVRLVPMHSQAHNNLGVLMARRQLPYAAIKEFVMALAGDPDNLTARANLAGILDVARVDNVVAGLIENFVRDPTNVNAYRALNDQLRNRSD